MAYWQNAASDPVTEGTSGAIEAAITMLAFCHA
jgi:hypothetical protein